MNKFTIASVAVATALLAGCGGSSSSDGGKGDELPSGGEAQACFNPELWEDGTHEAKWQTRWSEGGTFYPQTERTSITNDIDFDEHKSITRVESIYNFSETPLGFEKEPKPRRKQKSRNSQSANFDYYVIDEQSTSVSYAGDNYVDYDDGIIIEEDMDVNSPAAPLWLFGSEKGEKTPFPFTTTWVGIEDDHEERYTFAQNDHYVTFNGFDTVDVNGVSVEACYFTIETVQDGNWDGEVWTDTTTLEHWIDKDTGLLVKSVLNLTEDDDGVIEESYQERELKSYSIDGEVIFSTEDEELPEA